MKLANYFDPDTWARCWIDIKMSKRGTSTGTHRWGTRYVLRKQVNEVFVGQPDMNAESMGIVASNHVSIKQPTNIIYHINVATLIDPS